METPEDLIVERTKQANERDEQANHRDHQADDRDVVADRHHHILHGYMKLVLWATVLLVVVGILSVIRSFYVENVVDELDEHTVSLREETNAAKEAAVEARDVLQNALDESTERLASGESAAPEAIRDALIAVDRIEQHLCGGRCPPVESGE